jgi:MFS family permease
LVYSLALAAFALSDRLWLSLLIIPFAGWAMIANFASTNTVLQTLVSDEMRGRVMSLFAMAFLGMTPFGLLVVGVLQSRLASAAQPMVGASRTMLIAAAICLAASIRYWLVLPTIRKFVRPIYVERGILKEIAEGLQTAAIDE